MNHFYKINPDFKKAIGPILISMFLLISIQVVAQTPERTVNLNSKEIRLKKSEILRLFSLKSNDISSISIQSDQREPLPVEISIINHLNPGEKSGAIAARLVLDKVESRLLLNRKDRREGLVYWIAILPDQSEVAYKLKQETRDEFVLVLVSKNEVVTD